MTNVDAGRSNVQAQIRAYLEANFARDPNPSSAAMQMMATQCGQTKEAINVWFAARRNLRAPAAQPDSSYKPDKIDRGAPFGLISLKIGDWQYNAQFRGDLTGQFDFDRQTIAWMILKEGVAQRIEMPFDSIVGLELSATSRTTARISLRISTPPTFLEEMEPSWSKPTTWRAIDDFSTGHQASVNLIHTLISTKNEIEFHLRALLRFSPVIKTLVSQSMSRSQQAQANTADAIKM